MRRYETITILDPDLSEDQRTAVFSRLQELIPQQGGLLAFVDEWGSRQLGYEIKKRERGYYVRFDYCGTGAVVDEIERLFRIDDRVLKYMTVLTDDDPNYLKNITVGDNDIWCGPSYWEGEYSKASATLQI